MNKTLLIGLFTFSLLSGPALADLSQADQLQQLATKLKIYINTARNAGKLNEDEHTQLLDRVGEIEAGIRSAKNDGVITDSEYMDIKNEFYLLKSLFARFSTPKGFVPTEVLKLMP